MENFGKFVTILLFMIINPIMQGYVFVKLWSWFFVTTFPLPELRIPQAIGVMILISLVRYRKTPDVKEDGTYWEKFFTGVFTALAMYGFALLMGYIVKQFI